MPHFRLAALPLVALTAILASSLCSAEIYKYVDKDGNVVFTDKPGKGREQMHLAPLPTISLPKGNASAQKTAPPPKTKPGETYSKLLFTSPADNSAFWSGSGNFVISVEAKPPLRNGDKFKLALDGKVLGTNSSGAFPVKHINRGTHRASLSVVNAKGQIIQSGPSITFTVHRPSVIRRNERKSNGG